jgi:hypothetical protein
MKTMELNKMGLTPLTDLEAAQIQGGFWSWHEKLGFYIGMFIGTSLRITRDIARRLLEQKAANTLVK